MIELKLVEFVIAFGQRVLPSLLSKFAEGMFGKASEDAFDALRKAITQKLKGTKTGQALEAGEDIDPRQVIIDVEAMESDTELDALLTKVNELLAENTELRKELETLVAQAKNDTTITMTGESHDESTFKQIGKVEGQNISF